MMRKWLLSGSSQSSSSDFEWENLSVSENESDSDCFVAGLPSQSRACCSRDMDIIVSGNSEILKSPSSSTKRKRGEYNEYDGQQRANLFEISSVT